MTLIHVWEAVREGFRQVKSLIAGVFHRTPKAKSSAGVQMTPAQRAPAEATPVK